MHHIDTDKAYREKLDRNCTRMLQAILNKSWKQHHSKQQLCSYLSPISKTIQIRWTRHMGHCWRNKDELISDILLWTSAHRHASIGQPRRSYIQQLCMDTGCSREDLLKAMDDENEWQECWQKSVLAVWPNDEGWINVWS